jgi:hypothetical protein
MRCAQIALVLLASGCSGAASIVGTSDGAVDSVLLHWNGTAWSTDTGVSKLGFLILRTVWGSGPNNVWAVGACCRGFPAGASSIVHWNGTAWSTSTAAFQTDLLGVWGSGPNDVWAVSLYAAILHWNGTAWSSTNYPAMDLHGVWGSGPDDVWTVGDVAGGGILLHHGS